VTLEVSGFVQSGAPAKGEAAEPETAPAGEAHAEGSTTTIVEDGATTTLGEAATTTGGGSTTTVPASGNVPMTFPPMAFPTTSVPSTIAPGASETDEPNPPPTGDEAAHP
jgi:hypothetical protein